MSFYNATFTGAGGDNFSSICAILNIEVPSIPTNLLAPTEDGSSAIIASEGDFDYRAESPNPSSYGVGAAGEQRTEEWLQQQVGTTKLARGNTVGHEQTSPPQPINMQGAFYDAVLASAGNLINGDDQLSRDLGEALENLSAASSTKGGAFICGSDALNDFFTTYPPGAFDPSFVPEAIKAHAADLRAAHAHGSSTKSQTSTQLPGPTQSTADGAASTTKQPSPQCLRIQRFMRYSPTQPQRQRQPQGHWPNYTSSCYETHLRGDHSTSRVNLPKPIGYERDLRRQQARMEAELKAKADEQRHLITSYKNRPETPGVFVPRRCFFTEEENEVIVLNGENDSPATAFIGERIVVDSISPSNSFKTETSVHKLCPPYFPLGSAALLDEPFTIKAPSAVERLLPFFYTPIHAAFKTQLPEKEQVHPKLMTPPSSNIEQSANSTQVITPPPNSRVETVIQPSTPTSMPSPPFGHANADSDVDSEEEVIPSNGRHNLQRTPPKVLTNDIDSDYLASDEGVVLRKRRHNLQRTPPKILTINDIDSDDIASDEDILLFKGLNNMQRTPPKIITINDIDSDDLDSDEDILLFKGLNNMQRTPPKAASTLQRI